MNKTLRITLIVLAVLVGVAALVWTGFAFGRASQFVTNFWPGGMMSGSARGWFDDSRPPSGFGMGPGMMRNFGRGYGMMGGYGRLTNAEPLSVDESREAVEAYLTAYGEDDPSAGSGQALAIKEIMIFEYNAYAIVVEESTGIGAFELLVDPATKAVYPEYGPNMMWNLKYGMHSGRGFGGYGMMGGFGRGHGMMGGYGYYSDESYLDTLSAEMPISAEKAAQIAQDYLDAYEPGVEVTDEVTAFYGYYTIDLEKDGLIVGMLSVNGYSGQVFPHTWHGDFIEMSEE
ncbi:MAG: hypothetical protein FJ010_02395 [Chloroflexi bacterium]|nr:hypothetical protein [Chloroflexota bacterium]